MRAYGPQGGIERIAWTVGRLQIFQRDEHTFGLNPNSVCATFQIDWTPMRSAGALIRDDGKYRFVAGGFFEFGFRASAAACNFF